MYLLNRKSVQVALIVLLGMLVYVNTLRVPFFFDDYTNIINSPLIKDFANFADLDSVHKNFGRRYFGFLTFALNYRLHGLNVTGYHLVNIAVHLMAAVLVYRLVFLTFRTPQFSHNSGQGEAGTRAGFTALLAALLFVAHPLQTQAVTYIVQRFASLGAMFYLLSLTCYIEARLIRNESDRRDFAAGAWYLAALAAAYLAWNTKETSFTLPFMVLLYELLFFNGVLKKHAKALFIGITLLLGSAVTFLILWSGELKWSIIVGVDQAMRLQTNISRLHYLATQCRVLVSYLRLTLFPVGQHLDYDYPISRSFFEPRVILSGLTLAVLFAAALFCLNLSRMRAGEGDEKAPLLRLAAFGVFWFFITLSIESSIIPIVDVIFEHRMYLPSAGLFMALAAAVSYSGGEGGVIPGWPRTPILIITAGVVLLLAGMTVARNRVWQDDVLFWQDNAGKAPQNSRVFLNLGRSLERRGDLAGAEKAYRTASVLDPDQTDSLINLGLIYIQSNRFTEALAQFKAALAKDASLAEAHNNLGKVYGMLGQLDEARQEFLQAVKLKPTMAEPYNNIGYLYALQKRYPEALSEYDKCLALDPDYELGYLNRGKALLATGRISEASADFKRALKINPSNAEAAEHLRRAANSR